MDNSRYLRMCTGGMAIGITAAVMGCSKGGSSFEKPPIPVRVQSVEASLPTSVLNYSATLVPGEQVEVSFKVPGYVEDLLRLAGHDGTARDVQKGDQVAKGAVLARLRDSDYQAKLNQAKSALDEARAALAQALRDFERAERLVQADVMSKNDFERAREKLELTRARTGGAESQVEEAQIQLQDTVVRSPLDCVLVARLLERGTLVSPGMRAFVLADLRKVKAVFGAPDYLLRTIKPGDALTAKVEALQREFHGTVTAVSPSADPKSRVFEVEITILNPELQLKDGMIATVRLGATAVDGTVPVIPIHAVVRPPSDSAGYMVYVVEDREGKKTARGRRVTLGNVFGNRVVVNEGLSVGDRIITVGANIVSDGSAVMINP